MSEKWIEGFPEFVVRRGPRIDILLPTFWYPAFGTLLSHRLFIRWRHFDPTTKRPYNCPDPGNCPACEYQKTTYMTGWMAACMQHTPRLIVLQFSELALKDLARYAERNPLKRGLLVKTVREDTRVNGKMHAEILGTDERERLPDEFDVRETLEKVWGIAAAKLLTEHRLGASGIVKPGSDLAEGEVRE